MIGSAVRMSALSRGTQLHSVSSCLLGRNRTRLYFHTTGKVVKKSFKSTTPAAAAAKRTIGTTRRTVTRTRRQKATLASENGATAADTTIATESAESSGFSFSRFRDRFNDYLNQPRTIPIPRWVSPRHFTYTLSECFGHASFILVAISYAVDDFLQLRIIAIAGSTAMLFFSYFHPHGRVLWLPFKWNLAFTAINSYRVGKIYLDRYLAGQLSEDYQRMYTNHFSAMDRVDFARLVKLGETERFRKGDAIVTQGQNNRYIRLVLSGEMSVLRDGQLTYELYEGNFISESGLHAGLLLRGNVESCCTIIAKTDDVTVIRWNRTELTHLLEVDKNIRRSLKAVLSWDIIEKLKHQRVLLKTGKITNPDEWTQKRQDQSQHRYGSILHNMLSHPQYLNKRKEELKKYRQIHHIDDEHHEMALREVGWTVSEFNAGSKVGAIDEDVEELQSYGINWYIQDLKFRIFG